MSDDIQIIPPKTNDDIEIIEPPSKSQQALKGTTAQAARGFLEAVPFVGEKMASSAGLPEPKTFPERLTKRAAANLPYALGAGLTGFGAIPAAVGFVGATGLGQLAEEIGVPKEYQPPIEMIGGAAGPISKDVTGRVLGYIEKPLEEIYSKAKNIFSLGPGAKTAQGMKYGHGDTPKDAIRNLDKATELATERAGNKTSSINGNWITQTQQKLGQVEDRLFGGKTFYSDDQFIDEINKLSQDVRGTYGQQGNIVKTIIEKNIGGARPGGTFTNVNDAFKAEDLRNAIKEVNTYLATAEGPQAALLHDLNDSLHRLAEVNLPTTLSREYKNWREKYHSFATIRDLFQKSSGTTPSGQIPVDNLLNQIKTRTGGNPERNPLFTDLAEYGDIFKGTPTTGKPGLIKGTYQSITESPLSKALQLGLQQRVPSKLAQKAGTVQAVSPLQKYTQTGDKDATR
jgi:hypothetical protein